jgi:hypothetical protein
MDAADHDEAVQQEEMQATVVGSSPSSVTRRLVRPVRSATSREGYREIIQDGGEAAPCEVRGFCSAR